MGVSYSVYIGPYIQVYSPEKELITEIQSCPNKKCLDHGQLNLGQFCSKCGNKIQPVSTTNRGRISFDVYDETKGRISEVHPEEPIPAEKEDYLFFVPNIGKIGREFSAYDTQIETFDAKIIADEIQTLCNKFSKELKRFNEAFETNNVRVVWGVVAYSS